MPMTIPPVVEFADFPAMLAAIGSMVEGREYTCIGAVISGGIKGTRWKKDGSVIRPSGRQLLYHSNTNYDGTVTTTEQIQKQMLLPASLLDGVTKIHGYVRHVLSATDAAARTVRWHLGTAGTISDTTVSFLSVGLTARTQWHPLTAFLGSATALRYPSGSNLIMSATEASQVLTSAAGDVTISNTSNALYMTATMQLGAGPTATPSADVFGLAVE